MASGNVEVEEEVARRRLALVGGGGQLLQPCDWNSSTTESRQFVVHYDVSPEASVWYASAVFRLFCVIGCRSGEWVAVDREERKL
jgi:hypothetical protein